MLFNDFVIILIIGICSFPMSHQQKPSSNEIGIDMFFLDFVPFVDIGGDVKKFWPRTWKSMTQWV
jgi:hypothetical protein